jgi:hypothetical protein
MLKKAVRLSKRRKGGEGGGGGAGGGGAGFNAILPKLLARQKKKIEDNLQVKLSHVSHVKVLTYG